MHLRRVMMTWMLVLLALACLAPALALADGPSAGDQQYTDPLGGSNGAKTKTTSTSSSSAPPATTSPSSGTAAAGSSSSSSGSSGSTATPVATTASSSSSTTTSTTSTLPRTGFDLWAGAGIGVVLLGAGMTLRRRAPSAG